MTTSIHSAPIHSSGTHFAAHAAAAAVPPRPLAKAAARFAETAALTDAGPQPSGLTRSELRQIVLDILG